MAADKERTAGAVCVPAGLCILVAIPLPGTGAWTGSLVAAVFDIRLKHAFPAIALGVLIAGIIVSVVTYGVTIFL